MKLWEILKEENVGKRYRDNKGEEYVMDINTYHQPSLYEPKVYKPYTFEQYEIISLDFEEVKEIDNFQLLQKLMWEFYYKNDRGKLNWKDCEGVKYCIIYDYWNNRWDILGTHTCKALNQIYFSEKKIAEICLKEVVVPFVEKYKRDVIGDVKMKEKKFEIIDRNETNINNWSETQDYIHEALFSLDCDRYDIERELDIINKLNIGHIKEFYNSNFNLQYTIKRIE